MIEQFPELADQGFWYHVEAIEEVPEKGGTRLRPAFNGSMTANIVALPVERGGTRTVSFVVRSPSPVAAVAENGTTAGQMLVLSGETERPYGRIRGN